jgi:hypothetical protein
MSRNRRDFIIIFIQILFLSTTFTDLIFFFKKRCDESEIDIDNNIRKIKITIIVDTHVCRESMRVESGFVFGVMVLGVLRDTYIVFTSQEHHTRGVGESVRARGGLLTALSSS